MKTARRSFLLNVAPVMVGQLVVGCSCEANNATTENANVSVEAGTTFEAGVDAAVVDAATGVDTAELGITLEQDAAFIDVGLVLDAGADAGPSSSCEGPICGDVCCAADESCIDEAECVPTQGACETNDDCQHDTQCVDAQCLRYGTSDLPTINSECVLQTDLTSISPVVQCQWSGPPETDPFPTMNQVMVTPMVADLNLDGDPNTSSPSVIFASYSLLDYQLGYVRVISGSDCSQQLTTPLAEDSVNPVAPVAIADLTGDGVAEIIAPAIGGGMIAFKVSDDKTQLERLWRSGTCADGVVTPDATGGANRWSGPSVLDLDDDGTPEVVWGANVYGADGCMISGSLGFPAYSQGIFPVLADVDSDGRVEMVGGNSLYEWDTDLRDWVADPLFTGPGLNLGHVALADFGDHPVEALPGQDLPEVVVVSNGQVTVQTIAGTILFGPMLVPGGGGGAPTIADFDGDGHREFAVAGGGAYSVFDLDCIATAETLDSDAGISACNTGRTDGILWSQPSNDATSSVTGSSVFDFDADGRSEVVYADQCFLRIYDGATGQVAASIANTSATTYENPVIADTDGDFRSEVVYSANDYYAPNLGCATTDPLFPATAAAPTHGVFILRDAADAWAASRPIWNQHAYSVVNVNDDGTVPKTSEVAVNWQDDELNNFRQNTQGELEALGLSDLTVSDGTSSCRDETILRANVCNRGTLPAPQGVEVLFSADGGDLCRGQTSATLEPGTCLDVICDPNQSLESGSVDIEADPEDTQQECINSNNRGRTLLVNCD